jgi:hypothetical protein
MVGLNATNWVGKMGSSTFSWQRVNVASGKLNIVGDASQVCFVCSLTCITDLCLPIFLITM